MKNYLRTVQDKHCDKHSVNYNLTAAYSYNLEDENMSDADNSCNLLVGTCCLHPDMMDNCDLNSMVCIDFG